MAIAVPQASGPFTGCVSAGYWRSGGTPALGIGESFLLWGVLPEVRFGQPEEVLFGSHCAQAAFQAARGIHRVQCRTGANGGASLPKETSTPEPVS